MAQQISSEWFLVNLPFMQLNKFYVITPQNNRTKQLLFIFKLNSFIQLSYFSREAVSQFQPSNKWERFEKEPGETRQD